MSCCHGYRPRKVAACVHVWVYALRVDTTSSTVLYCILYCTAYCTVLYTVLYTVSTVSECYDCVWLGDSVRLPLCGAAGLTL